MPNTRRVLIVAPDAEVAGTLAGWVSLAGHEALVVADFATAKPELDANPPALLITQVKLGAYNGLHLAIRARSSRWDTPSIVIGDPDCVLEAEAKQEHVRYVSELEESTFSEMARRMIGYVH